MHDLYAFVEKAAAAALAEGEERFHELADDAPFAIWTAGPEGEVLYANRTCREQWGRGAPERPEADFTSGIHPRDAERFAGELRSASRERRGLACEVRVRDVSGGWRPMEAHAVPAWSASGEFLGLVGTGGDVAGPRDAGGTGRRDLEDAARESAALLRAVLDRTPDAVFLKDLESRLLLANAATFVVIGKPAEECLGKTDEEFYDDPADGRAIMANDRRIIASGQSETVEEAVSTPTGLRYYLSTKAPFRDASGGVVGLVGVARDITERKQTEEALRQSREDLDRAQAVGQIGWWRLDTRTGTLTWSDENYRIFGVPKGAPMTYDAFLGMVHPEDRGFVEAEWEAGVRGEPYDIEHRIVAGGEVKWVREKAYLEHDAAGRLLGGFGITQDITARRLAEDALRESEAERAAQQERERLARDLHDSVSQAIFAAALKAEALEMATECADDGIAPAARQVCRLCKGALADLRAMLLELRGEGLEGMPMEQLLRQLAEAAEGRTSAKVGLSVDGPFELPPGVQAAFYRVAQEALNNVARHARAEHAWITMESTETAVYLEVRDDGRGFEPRDFGPAHLGIRTMHERAAEAGARLDVISAPGRGTRVVLTWERPAAGE